MHILYAGDGSAEGPARYLLAVLKRLRARVLHVPPDQPLEPKFFVRVPDAIILSDYPSSQVSGETQRAIAQAVEKGSGLLMVGGWASFAAPDGRWRATTVGKLLPVQMAGKDDRRNFAGGALLLPECTHPILRGLTFNPPPMIVGMNVVRASADATVILSARPVRGIAGSKCTQLKLGGKLPLLVVRDHTIRTAAFMTDVAPHWCGGLVDWGRSRVKIRHSERVLVEVGDRYVKFLSQLVRWLADNRKEAERP